MFCVPVTHEAWTLFWKFIFTHTKRVLFGIVYCDMDGRLFFFFFSSNIILMHFNCQWESCCSRKLKVSPLSRKIEISAYYFSSERCFHLFQDLSSIFLWTSCLAVKKIATHYQFDWNLVWRSKTSYLPHSRWKSFSQISA